MENKGILTNQYRKEKYIKAILYSLGIAAFLTSGYFLYRYFRRQKPKTQLSQFHLIQISRLKNKIKEKKLQLDKEILHEINFLTTRIYEDLSTQGTLGTKLRSRMLLLDKLNYEETFNSSIADFLKLYSKVEALVSAELNLSSIPDYEKIKENLTRTENVDELISLCRLYIPPQNTSEQLSKEKVVEAFNLYLKLSKDRRKHADEKIQAYVKNMRENTKASEEQINQKEEEIRKKLSMINYIYIKDTLSQKYGIENEYHLYYLINSYNMLNESSEISNSIRDLSENL